jgi:tRNA threonylcarbamoyladenosine biosynthesis protein TsaE
MGAGNGITEYESFSEDETFRIGEEYGRKAHPGSVFSLEGDLGVGKTVFAKGFAQGLGITETVNSPTFTIMKIYEGGRLDLYHYDAYRIEDPSEMEEIGYTDYFYGEGTCLIEWACNIEEYLPEHFTKISIEKDPEKGFDYRRITVSEI